MVQAPEPTLEGSTSSGVGFSNIILEWTGLPVTNNLANSAHSALKSCITLGFRILKIPAVSECSDKVSCIQIMKIKEFK